MFLTHLFFWTSRSGASGSSAPSVDSSLTQPSKGSSTTPSIYNTWLDAFFSISKSSYACWNTWVTFRSLGSIPFGNKSLILFPTRVRTSTGPFVTTRSIKNLAGFLFDLKGTSPYFVDNITELFISLANWKDLALPSRTFHHIRYKQESSDPKEKRTHFLCFLKTLHARGPFWYLPLRHWVRLTPGSSFFTKQKRL